MFNSTDSVGGLNGRTVGYGVGKWHTKLEDVWREAIVSMRAAVKTWQDFPSPAPPLSIDRRTSGVSSGLGKPAVTYVTKALCWRSVSAVACSGGS